MDPDPQSLIFLANIVQPFSWELIFPLLLLLTLLLCSALVSGSEVAFFSIKNQDLESIKDERQSLYKDLNDLLEHPKTLLATILISNNFINVGIVILSAFITNSAFDFREFQLLGLLIEIVAITFLILLFGEVLPKVYANRKSLEFTSFMRRPMLILRKIFYPLSHLLVGSTDFIEKRLKNSSENLSVDELSQALELTSDENTTHDEQKILEGIVKFGNTTVKQIMKPRLDVVCIDINSDYSKVLSLILDSGYSRIPVYEEQFDNIKGTLYIKDLIPYIEEEKEFKWQELIRESFFVPENKKIDDLLNEFQEKKIHLAIVVDEFGGTSGIITLEDIIEEIVGDISDEFDDDELVYSKLDDRNYVFEGKIHLTDFFKVLEVEEEPFERHRAEADTLAGFLLEISGKFPEQNEEIVFDSYTFKIESLEGRRIKRIKVTKHEEQEEQSGDHS